MREKRNIEFDLKDCESLDDFCLKVLLKEAIPEDLILPLEYQGLRVFYEIIGPIIPLETE